MGGLRRLKPLDRSHRLTDAWILHSVVMAGRDSRATLRALLGVADFLNHAVPTFEQLSGALERLSAGGWIVADATGYAGSDRSHQITDSGSNVAEQRVRLEDALLDNQDALDGELRATGLLDRSTYDVAVAEYLAR